MLNARAALWQEYCRLHDLVVKLVASHELCRRFMQLPGVGPVAALSFMTAIDDPSRFKRSRDVAAYFGLTSRRWQSGSSIDVQGRISKAGDGEVRRALYEAAPVLLTRGGLMAILDLAAGRRATPRPDIITNALACPRLEPTSRIALRS